MKSKLVHIVFNGIHKSELHRFNSKQFKGAKILKHFV